jgi:hypothetical protein
MTMTYVLITLKTQINLNYTQELGSYCGKKRLMMFREIISICYENDVKVKYSVWVCVWVGGKKSKTSCIVIDNMYL